MRFHNAVSKRIKSIPTAQLNIIGVWCAGLILGLHIIPALLNASKWEICFIHPTPFRFPLLMLYSFAPLLLSLLLIRNKLTHCFPCLCIAKGITSGFCSYLLIAHFFSGAWLSKILFLMTSSANSCLFLWFWLKYAKANNANIRNDIIILVCILTLICCLDGFILTSFLQRLL